VREQSCAAARSSRKAEIRLQRHSQHSGRTPVAQMVAMIDAVREFQRPFAFLTPFSFCMYN